MSDAGKVGKQFAVYIVVGVWNTVFGVLSYWACVWFCERLGQYGYLLASVISTVIAVTQSFVMYKLLVFRTHGNWLPEYLKCWSVYGGASLINFILLPISVETIRSLSPDEYARYAPYVGGLLLTGVTVLISFFGHRQFTFKNKKG